MKILTLDKLNYFYGKLKPILNNKVDKVSGKGLSSNDFTNEYINKINNLETTIGQINTTLSEIIGE